MAAKATAELEHIQRAAQTLLLGLDKRGEEALLLAVCAVALSRPGADHLLVAGAIKALPVAEAAGLRRGLQWRSDGGNGWFAHALLVLAHAAPRRLASVMLGFLLKISTRRKPPWSRTR